MAVTKFITYGTTYSGNVPNAQPSGSRLCPFIPVMGANNLSLNHNLNAQLATMVEPTGHSWLSHGVLLGSSGSEVFRAPHLAYAKSPLFLLLLLNFRVLLYYSVCITLVRL